MDFLIEKTSDAEKGWDWLTSDPPPPDLPGAVLEFLRASPSGEPFRVGPYDAEDARVWALKTWGESPAPIRVSADPSRAYRDRTELSAH
jgi:hypothetical protein